jgi:hypothetical protein
MTKRTHGLFLSPWYAFALVLASTASPAQSQGKPLPREAGPSSSRSVGGAPDTKQPIRRPQPIIQDQGLNDPALKLTGDQRAQIDKILAAYLQEKGAFRQRLATSHDLSAAQVAAANKQSLSAFNAKVGQVLNASQRMIWDASMAKSGLAGGLPPSGKPLATGQSQR